MKCDTDANDLKRGKPSIYLDVPSLVSCSFCTGSNAHLMSCQNIYLLSDFGKCNVLGEAC